MLNLLPLLLAWVLHRRHVRSFLLFRQPILTGPGVAATIAGMEGATPGFLALMLLLHMPATAGIPVTGARLVMDGSGWKVAGAELFVRGDEPSSRRQQAIIKE
jgi:hypothetical protein